MEIRYFWMAWFLDQVTLRNLKSLSLMHCRIASLLKSLILICEWSDKDVYDKKNQRRVRKLKIEEQPGESVAEDCVNWFDLPWESHCGEKCRHSLKKNLSTTHFFFKRTSKVWLILVMKIEHGQAILSPNLSPHNPLLTISLFLFTAQIKSPAYAKPLNP